MDSEKRTGNRPFIIWQTIPDTCAEYEIIPDLIKHGVLKRIGIVVMESHYGREDEIMEAFRKEGFVVYSNEEPPYRTGTLFAVRKERTG